MSEQAFIELLKQLAPIILALAALMKSYFDGRAQARKNVLQGEENKAMRDRMLALELENQELHKGQDQLIGMLGEQDNQLIELRKAHNILKAAYSELEKKYHKLLADYEDMRRENQVLREKLDRVDKRQTGSLGARAL